MGFIQKDAFQTAVISYIGIILGYVNKGLLFVLFLSEEQIGLVSLLIVVGTLYAQLAGFGTAFTTLKFLPFFKDFERKHYGFLPFLLRVLMVGVVLTSAGFVLFQTQIKELYIDKSPAFVTYYWWVFPIGIGYVFYLFFEAYLRSFYKNILSVLSYEILLRLCVTTTLFLYHYNLISFDGFVKLNSLIYLLPPLVMMGFLWLQGELIVAPKNIQISKRFRKLMFGFSAYNYVNSLGFILVMSLDVMMLAQMVNLDATGIYATVVFIASALLVPYRSLNRISAPLVAEYWKSRNMIDMESIYRKSASVSLFIGLFCFIPLWLNIDLFFSFLKPSFLPGIWVFFTLMIGRFFEMFFGMTGIIFSTSKKYKYDIYFTIFLVLSVFILNLLFIPKWGMVGASISTSIALVLYSLGRYLFIYKAYRLNPFEKNQFIVLGLGIATLVLGEWIGSYFENLWVRAFVEMLLFTALFVLPVFVFKLEKETIKYLKKYLKKG